MIRSFHSFSLTNRTESCLAQVTLYVASYRELTLGRRRFVQFIKVTNVFNLSNKILYLLYLSIVVVILPFNFDVGEIAAPFRRYPSPHCMHVRGPYYTYIAIRIWRIMYRYDVTTDF